MIVDKTIPEAISPTVVYGDAPPSYENIGARVTPSSSGPISLPPTSPRAPSPASSSNKRSFYSPFSWATLTRNNEVRATIKGLIRSLVQETNPSDVSAGPSVLESCADTCSRQNVNFSSILQDRFIEDHTPMYWAIVKRWATPAMRDPAARRVSDAFIMALLKFSAPLQDDTVSEVHLACQLAADNVLFQRLRCFVPVPGTDAILLGSGVAAARDYAYVEESVGDGQQFVAHMVVPMFLQRLRISRVVDVEFIARGRLWSLAIFTWPRLSSCDRRRIPGESVRRDSTYTAGSWLVSLTMLDKSAPTAFDGRVIIQTPDERIETFIAESREATAATSTSVAVSALNSADAPSDILEAGPPMTSDDKHFADGAEAVAEDPADPPAFPSEPSPPSAEPQTAAARPITLPLRTAQKHQLAPVKSDCGSHNKFSQELLAQIEDEHVIALDQMDSPYISANGTLYVKLEGRLADSAASKS